MKTLKVNKEWYLEYKGDKPAFYLSLANSVVTENIIPWLTSFNNISLVETKTEEYEKIWFLDFGAKNMLLGLSAKVGSSGDALNVMIYLYRKNFEKISNYYDSNFYLFSNDNLAVSNVTGGSYYTLSRNFFILTKENNLITLFEGGNYDLPDDKSFIIFDEDNFGEKYIATKGAFTISGNKDMAIFYFNNEAPIIYMGKVIPEKFSEENYLITKKIHINYFSNGFNDFRALSTNILNISNINLETDKDTAHKLIEVNGVRYRKIIYNLWIEDSED